MAEKEETRRVRTACPAHCGIDACGMIAHVKGNRVVKLSPSRDYADPEDRGICLRGLSSLEVTYHPDRLKYPMKRVGQRGEGRFERISWDEAFETIAEKFKDIAAEHGWPAIGWVLGGPGGGSTKFGAYLKLASLTQSTRVSAWGYGDAGLPCGSRVIFGSQFPYAYLMGPFLDGRADPELIVCWGTNPAESAPLLKMRPIMDAKEKGALLSVIDPRFTVTAAKADQYLGLKPGTDTALALGLLHVIFKEGLQKADFITRHTNGAYLVRTDNGRFLRGRDMGEADSQDYVVWDTVSGGACLRHSAGEDQAITGTCQVQGIECKPAFQFLKDLAEEYPPARASEITGVPIEEIGNLGRRIGRAREVTFITHMGFTRTYYGDISLRALATVAAVTGNLMASFSGGRMPAVLNWTPFLKADPNKPSYKRLGILQLYDAIISGKPFPIKAVWFSFINFLNQCAHSNKIAKEVFPNLDFIVAAELFMTPTAKYCDMLLPTCSFLEFSDFIGHPFPWVQLQQKVIDPLYETKSDVDIAAGLAEKLGFGNHFQGGEDGFVDTLITSGDPSMEGITMERLKKGPMRVNKIPKMDPPFDFPFSTPSGKIELYAESLLEDGQALPVYLDPLETPLAPEGKKYPLAYVQGHSRFRTHSSFANVASLLAMNPEPVVDMNPKDAEDRGIADNDMVTVFNDRGRTTLKARITQSVAPGVVNIEQGWWIDQFKEGSVNHLTHDVINPVQEKVYEPNMHMNDVAVEVVKWEEVEA